MLLFTKSSDTNIGQIIIPSNRVYDIWAVGCRININYEGGDIIEVEGTYQKKIETVSVILSSPEAVNKLIRQFYKACNNHSAAFFFGEI